MEILAFAVFIGLILSWQARSEFALAFPDQVCGYCPMNIYFDRKQLAWVHENGERTGPLPGITRMTHWAHPYGIAHF